MIFKICDKRNKKMGCGLSKELLWKQKKAEEDVLVSLANAESHDDNVHYCDDTLDDLDYQGMRTIKVWNEEDMKQFGIENGFDIDSVKPYEHIITIVNNTDFPIRVNILRKVKMDVDGTYNVYAESEIMCFTGNNVYLTLSDVVVVTYTQGWSQIYEPYYKYYQDDKRTAATQNILASESDDVTNFYMRHRSVCVCIGQEKSAIDTYESRMHTDDDDSIRRHSYVEMMNSKRQ